MNTHVITLDPLIEKGVVAPGLDGIDSEDKELLQSTGRRISPDVVYLIANTNPKAPLTGFLKVIGPILLFYFFF